MIQLIQMGFQHNSFEISDFRDTAGQIGLGYKPPILKTRCS